MTYDPNKPRILVALGGRSSEREVSIQSGIAVAEALEQRGYPTAILDTASGKLLQTPEAHDLEKDPEKLREVANLPLVDIKRHFQLVFIAMHGKFGEDGILQGMFEEVGIPYTGSSPASSAVAMHKAFSKQIFERNHINTPEWEIIKSVDQKPRIGYPLVVKAENQGSSIGVALCQNEADYQLAIKQALEISDSALIEKMIKGTEITIGVIEKAGKPMALPVIEIKPKQSFFNYSAKYGDDTDRIVPARISPELTKKAQELAVKVFEILESRHFSRIDMIIDEKNELQVLELNSIPGLTSHSLLPIGAKAAGISFEDLIEEIVKDALLDKTEPEALQKQPNQLN